LTVEARYEKQRNKVTIDIKKFIQNKQELTSLLGATKIARWVFVVPIFDSKELINHASRKSGEVRERNLPYVTSDFHIKIDHLKDFTTEQSQAVLGGFQQLELDYNKVEPGVLVQWTAEHEDLVANLKDKAEKLDPSLNEADKRKHLETLIRGYIEGQNVLTSLNTVYPELWEKVNNCKRRRQTHLAYIGRAHPGNPPQVLEAQLNTFRTELGEAVPSLAEETKDILVREAVSDWMLRCPLDFI
jgi:hypothetical protein